METLTQLAKLLGEKNEKKLKDKITEMLIDSIEYQLESEPEWLIDFSSLLDDVRTEIHKNIKEYVLEKYMAKVKEKIDEGFDKSFGDKENID